MSSKQSATRNGIETLNRLEKKGKKNSIRVGDEKVLKIQVFLPCIFFVALSGLDLLSPRDKCRDLKMMNGMEEKTGR